MSVGPRIREQRRSGGGCPEEEGGLSSGRWQKGKGGGGRAEGAGTGCGELAGGGPGSL